MKTVSVIIPVYGVERYLARCVDSILRQTYNDLEIILVDDGSPDNCPVICDEYAQKDERVRVVHKKNGGLSSARNAGLSIATGEYVCFFDSDDFIEADMLEKLVSGIEENGDDVCVCGYYVDDVDEQENVLSSRTVCPNFSYMQSDFSLEEYESILGWCGYAWNKLYRRNVLEKGDFRFDEGISLVEDLLFNQKIFCCGTKIRFLSYSGYHYVQRKRETLGVKYYENYFQLKMRALAAKSLILQNWGVSQERISAFYNNNYVDLLWGALKNIANSFLNETEKKERVMALMNDSEVREALRVNKTQGARRAVKRFLLKNLSAGMLLKIFN